MYYINQAIAAIDPKNEPPASTNMTWTDELPYPPQWHQVAAAAVKANAAVYPLVRQARQQTRVDWGAQYSVSNLFALFPSFSGSRRLAILLGDTALYHHFRGDDAAALQCIQDGLSLADAVDKQPLLVSHLVANGIRALLVCRLQIIATGLTVQPALPVSDGGIKASTTAEPARVLIHTLLNDDASYRSLRRSLEGERVFIVETVASTTRSVYVLRPMFTLSSARQVHLATLAMEAAAATEPAGGAGCIYGSREAQ